MRRWPVGIGMLVAASWALPALAQPATWNFTQADVSSAQAAGNDGRGVLVAVVDTWVDFHDSEFGGRVVDEADCLGANGAASSCQDHSYHADQCDHGTHVAGTIASTDYGVAPQAEILAVEALSYDQANATCDGSTADVAAGIDFAVAHGAKVINLSLGDLVPLIFQDASITNSIAAAANAGVVVVVAAGNNSLPFTDNYGNTAIMVAATGPSGQLAGYSDSFVLPAGAVGLAAPGGDSGNSNCDQTNCILSTLPGNRLGLLQGTSMATPHVAGAAALLLGQDPARGRADVLASLARTARPLAGAGNGILDAGAALALRRAQAGAPPVVRSTPTTTKAPSTAAITSGAGGASVTPLAASSPARSAPAAAGTIPPATPVSSTAVPTTTIGRPPAKPGSASRVAAPVASPGLTASTHRPASSVGHHTGLLVLATALLVAVAAAAAAAGRRWGWS